MKRKTLIVAPLVLLMAALLGWGGFKLYQISTAEAASPLPSTTVKRSAVRIAVTAKGDLQGGKSEMLGAPMTGGGALVLKYLRNSGELVNEGDVVAEFDTTEQAYALREAEADLAEADQQVSQATADNLAREEEDRLSLVQAQSDVELAELVTRKNPLVARIDARQAELRLASARDRLSQLQKDLADRKATSAAGVAIQVAARNKVKMAADMATRNIAAMTLRAKSPGYVAVQANTNVNIVYSGMKLPPFQVGDTVRAGMAVAQIPDLKDWVVAVRTGELDRGHMAAGQAAEITVIAVPGKVFHGKVQSMGGTSGPTWNRTFECRISIDDPSPELRPGMSARVVITTGYIEDALWVPSQALFESDGRTFVYLKSGETFAPADVKLVEKSESQVVLTGLRAGQVVALASPQRQAAKKSGGSSATQALPKP